MDYGRLERLDTKKAERFRLAAYLFFFLCIATLLVGVVPAMYYGSGWWVLITLSVAGAFFFAAFFAGGVGWSKLQAKPTGWGESTAARSEPPFEGEPLYPRAPSDEIVRPVQPPQPSDQDRPPAE